MQIFVFVQFNNVGRGERSVIVVFCVSKCVSLFGDRSLVKEENLGAEISSFFCFNGMLIDSSLRWCLLLRNANYNFFFVEESFWPFCFEIRTANI
jgi:hypothetical protein